MEKEELLQDTKKKLRSVVQSAKGGVQASKLESEYHMIIGRRLPHRELGFQNALEFLTTIPDTVYLTRGPEGTVVHDVADQSTAHIQRMIKNQKASKKSSKAKSFSVRRPTARPAWGRQAGLPTMSPGRWTPQNRAQNRPQPQGMGRGDGGRGMPQQPWGGPRPAGRPPQMEQPWRGPHPGGRMPQMEQPWGGPRPVGRAPQMEQRWDGFPYGGRMPQMEQPWGGPQPGGGFPASNRPQRDQSLMGPRGYPLPPSGGQNRPGQQRDDRPKSPLLSAPTRPFGKPTAAIKPQSTPPGVPGKGRGKNQGGKLGRSKAFTQAVNQTASQGQREAVPPRFRKKNEIIQDQSSAVPSPGDGRKAAAGGLPAKKPEGFVTQLIGDPDLLTEDYKTMLNNWAAKNEIVPVYETMHAGKGGVLGFVSTVNLGPRCYGSDGVHRSKKESERHAAINAFQAEVLNNREGLKNMSITISNDGDADQHQVVKERIRQILEKKPNGLWSTRLTHVFEEMFGEAPPEGVEDAVDDWPDVVKVETVEGSNKKILYPVPTNPTPVRLKQQDVVFTATVPSAKLPKSGTKLNAFVTHVNSPHEFYIQRSDSCIELLMKRLKATYESRGSPKNLIQPEVSMFCVAQYSDGAWYRAQISDIIKKSSETFFELCYIDFGNRETVSENRVRRILDNLCTDPVQSFRCSLADVFPLEGGDTWSPDSAASERICDVFLPQADGSHTELLFHIVEVNDARGCVVKAYDPEVLDTSINETLVTSQLALEAPLAQEPGPLILPEDGDWRVFVSYTRTTTDLRIRLEGPEFSDKLEKLEEDLEKYAASVSRQSLDGAPLPPVESICIAQLNNDRDETCYYRVKIVAIDTSKADVEFLDHGGVESVPCAKLTPLPVRLNQLPYQSIPAKLTGLESYENDDDVISKLTELTWEKTCVGEVNDRMDVVSLTLWDTTGDEDININETVAKVLKVANLTPRLPPVNGTIEVSVSHLGQEGQVFFQVHGPGYQAVQKLAEDMADVYGKEMSADLFVSAPEADKLYMAKYTDDKWYRVLVDGVIMTNRKVSVKFVDFGNRELVPLSCLREIRPDDVDVRAMPMQALECRLAYLPPEGGMWTEAALERLGELLFNDQINVLEILEPASDGDGGDSGVPSVEIYNTAEDGELVALSELFEPDLELFLEPSWQEVDNTIGDDTEGDLTDEQFQTITPNAVDGGVELTPGNAPKNGVHTPDDTATDRDSTAELVDVLDSLYDALANVSFTKVNAPQPQPGAASSSSAASITSDINRSNTGVKAPALATDSDTSLVTGGSGTSDVPSQRAVTSHEEGEEEGAEEVLPPNLVLPQSGDDLFVTWSADPSIIWCVKDEELDNIKRLTEEMCEYFEAQQDAPLVPHPRESKVYACEYLDIWYRVKVNSVIVDGGQVSVHFLDYGDFTIVPFRSLRHLPAQFRQMPFQAFKCFLEGVKPLTTVWSTEAQERLSELIESKTMTAWIHMEHTRDAVAEGLSVTLVRQEEGQAFVHKILLAEGLASKK